MIRRIVLIDREKCNGCGLCARACHEGAIGMEDGKAVLLRDDYCDGMGDCLPECPTGAISFEEREAAAYDEAAVKAHMAARIKPTLSRQAGQISLSGKMVSSGSQLKNWPPQIKLAPVKAPYYQEADLLIAADCTAYACGDFHQKFMRDRVTLIGCPKLDAVDYSEKLTDILLNNSCRSITLLRMEVPCCGGLERAVRQAIANSGKEIPLQVFTVMINGGVR